MTVTSLNNRVFRVKSRPDGLISRDNFEFATEPVPEPKDGEFVVKTLVLSLDPTNRIWLTDMDQYMPPVQIGEVMRGFGIGQIVQSRNANYKVGQLVSGAVGWQEYSVGSGKEPWRPFMPLPDNVSVPPEVLAGAAGGTGLTAYFGITDIARAKPGQTLVISAAAGAVGSIAGQIGKIVGCRVVGIAGSDEKCNWLVKDLGFDAAVNYKKDNWKKALADATPDGIDINFENVGGEILQEVFARMNLHSCMVVCGLISAYNDWDGEKTRIDLSRVLMKRIRLQGFIVSDYYSRFPEGTQNLIEWIKAGRIKSRETIVEGLENAPDAVNQLFDGRNIGKLLIRVAK